jgi:hypothetical protein
MLEEEDGLTTLIGFVIVLIVGLNIVFFLSDISGFGGAGTSNVITGAATVSCKDISEGIKCGDVVFTLAKNGCQYNTVKVCTNKCQLARLYANDNRICPTACKSICVPSDIAQKL